MRRKRNRVGGGRRKDKEDRGVWRGRKEWKGGEGKSVIRTRGGGRNKSPGGKYYGKLWTKGLRE